MKQHRYEYQPIRVRAFLQTPVISDQFLPLDGALYYHAVREVAGAQVVTAPNRSMIQEAHGGISLPIKHLGHHNEDNAWFYAASFAQWPSHTVEDRHTYNKRFDVAQSHMIDFGKKKAKVQTGRGRFKSYHISVYCRHALYIDWYLNADKIEIEKALRFVTHLGKKTSQGYGSVLRWEVRPWHSDWSVRGYEDNRLMRAVPTKKPSYKYGIRPSYWHPKHQYNAVLPRHMNGFENE